MIEGSGSTTNTRGWMRQRCEEQEAMKFWGFLKKLDHDQEARTPEFGGGHKGLLLTASNDSCKAKTKSAVNIITT